MLHFGEGGHKTWIATNSRVSEYCLFAIVKHVKRSQLHIIDPAVCKIILKMATSHLVSPAFFASMSQKINENVSYRFPDENIHLKFLNFLDDIPYLNFDHFFMSFDIEKYIMNLMNNIYWSYVDRAITHTIKYRKRENTSYEHRIRVICESLKNISDIESISYLLFYRYKGALEPYILLHTLLYNLEPMVKVKFYIANRPRACSFGDNCRGGFVFLNCKGTSENGAGENAFSMDYCLCNKHLESLKSTQKIAFK